MNPNCEVVYVAHSSDQGLPCGKRAVAECDDCGTAICEECRLTCCGDSWCPSCYNFHITNACVRKPMQAESLPQSNAQSA